MAFYWIKTHRIIKWLAKGFIWEGNTRDRAVYLTFDDGPTPDVTDFVLRQLDRYNAKATFFCIGSNIDSNHDIFKRIIDSGHGVANHTYNHLNGWTTKVPTYLENVKSCEASLEGHNKSKLFRPPYGKLSLKQLRLLRQQGYRIIMWDILSADFDQHIQPEVCLQNVLKNISAGSIIIFHDSVKAWPNLEYALPLTLKFLKENNFETRVLS
jgi:peptidoglycan-N-acetylglucosamine deacetylase